MKILSVAFYLVVAWFSLASSSEQVRRQASSASSVISASSSSSSRFSAPTTSSAPTANDTIFDFTKHFCRVWRHASTLADGKIYIDGGNTYVPKGNATFSNTSNGSYDKGMNSFLFSIDLSRNFSSNDTSVYTAIPKPGYVPNGLIEHILWFSRATRKIYQLGGWFSINNQQSPVYKQKDEILEPAIWQYDIDTRQWTQTSFKLNNTSFINRLGASANCDAPALNKSFAFEGYLQQRSQPETATYAATSDFSFVEGMLSLDTSGLTLSSESSAATLTNITVPDYIGPRMNGAMVHIPVGKQGVIAHIGGQTTNDPTPFGQRIANANAGNSNINMSYVDLYDVETGYWFRQETFGAPETPTGRSDICTVLVSASDGSSHNIFVIAGVDAYNDIARYEEWWVLTIPSFMWKKVYTRDRGRYGHTCHLVGENIVVIGGMNTKEGGNNVDYCDNRMPADIFSLPLMEYTGIFDAAGAKRAPPVPDDIVSIIGGTRYGGAYITQPKVWSDGYLQYVFNPTLTRPSSYRPSYTLVNVEGNNTTPAPAPSPPPKRSSKAGAIAGGVVGGLAVLVGLAVVAFCIARRRKAKRAAHGPTSELPSYYDVKESPKAAVVEAPPYQDPTELPTNKSDPDVSTAGPHDHDEVIRTTTLETPNWHEEADHVSPLGSPRGHAHHPSTSTTNTLTEDYIGRKNSHRVSEISGPTSGRLSRQSEVSDHTVQPRHDLT